MRFYKFSKDPAVRPRTETYTRGLDLSGSLQGAGGIGGLLARTDHTSFTPSHSYYHADGSGNITALINTNQLVVAKYHYDPFGNTLAKSGPLAEANTYRFSSKEIHATSGLYYYEKGKGGKGSERGQTIRVASWENDTVGFVVS